jgi:hypothetical protein
MFRERIYEKCGAVLFVFVRRMSDIDAKVAFERQPMNYKWVRGGSDESVLVIDLQ